MNKLTVKQALSQDIIRKHWQPAYKCYFYSADGCGDTLFPTAFSALGTWELKQSAKARIARNVARRESAALRRDLGLKRVVGSLGGIYFE